MSECGCEGGRRVSTAWAVGAELWIVEFPDGDAARRARETYRRLVEAEGPEEAQAWVEDIIGRHGGRLV